MLVKELSVVVKTDERPIIRQPVQLSVYRHERDFSRPDLAHIELDPVWWTQETGVIAGTKMDKTGMRTKSWTKKEDVRVLS